MSSRRNIISSQKSLSPHLFGKLLGCRHVVLQATKWEFEGIKGRIAHVADNSTLEAFPLIDTQDAELYTYVRDLSKSELKEVQQGFLKSLNEFLE